MMLRLQQERMHAGLIPSLREYSRYWGLTLDGSPPTRGPTCSSCIPDP